MTKSKIYDFTELTCTNLMIKIKILKRKLKESETLEFITTREGHTDVEKIFRKKPFHIISEKREPNVYYIKVWRGE